MRYRAFRDAVRGYGVDLPVVHVASHHPNGELMGLPSVPHDGAKKYSDRYTSDHIRRWVMSRRLIEVTGSPTGKGLAPRLHREAVDVGSARTGGWVVIADRQVTHHRNAPPVSIFDGGAVCVPVPDWAPDHRP